MPRARLEYGMFPLELVAFPGSYLPLYVFEERYKKLINDCIEGDKEFAINYSTGKKIYEFGCLVRVSEVVQMHDNGEMNIIVHGTERAKLIEMTDSSSGEFMRGVFDTYDAEDKNFSEPLLKKVAELYNSIVESVSNPIMPRFEYEDLSRLINPSYVLAQKAGLSPPERQEIISLDEEDDRIKIIENHLKKVKPLAARTEFIQRVVKNNGYIGPSTFGI
jgi:Lon protease-like protein